MIKETSASRGTTKGLIGITAAGAAEGALIGFIPGGPGGALVMGGVGGVTAFGLEMGRRALANAAKKTPETQDASVVKPMLGEQNGLVDVTVETTSVTQRTDAPEGETSPIVKSSTEQASGIPMSDLPDALSTLRARTQVNIFPAWSTTVNEKTVASTNSAATYTLVPQRIK